MQRVRALSDLLQLLADAGDYLEVQTENGAGVSLGALTLYYMIEEAQKAFPETQLTLWVDCADRAGAVQEALRVGLTHLQVDLPDPVFAKLSDIATQSGAQLRRR